MQLDRRQFLGDLVLAAGCSVGGFGSLVGGVRTKAYGSGYFGEWIEDEFGLPAFDYTCDQENDSKAVTKVNPGILAPRQHIHQIGNDRLVAVVSNYGDVRVRQDEGAPKFLNDHDPVRGCFAGGIGYLTDGTSFLGTLYPGNTRSFSRVFGSGYLRKKVAGYGYAIDQTIFAPFGDDPVLISRVTVANQGASPAQLRWVEHWGCQPYQFSFRAFMESFAAANVCTVRREFAARFQHRFRLLGESAGLIETKEFLGLTPAEEQRWRGMVAYLEKTPNPFLTAPVKNAPADASFDDLHPPSTFLVSLDAPADAVSSDGSDFFGEGGAGAPSGLDRQLSGELTQGGLRSALLLERRFALKPGESHTLHFLYGYLPRGAQWEPLYEKYRRGLSTAWQESGGQWKRRGLRFSVPDAPWVARETAWNHYSLRSSLTYDDFFGRHILSQGSVYQYVMGFQGAARDPLQHALPFLFSDPAIVREVLDYTLKEVRPDGSIPYGLVGHGMPMPTTSDYSSDMPLWLIWAVSEYVLATRDRPFLDAPVATVYGPGTASVSALLERCYHHLVDDVRTGQHGLMRMLHDDWNDALVQTWVPPEDIAECLEQGESVVNSAMAAYVYDRYARLLTWAGRGSDLPADARHRANEHREAVRRQWTGRWFRRAWLGPKAGWLGEKGLWLEPQPWAIISGITDEAQTRTLIQAIDEELRSTSPIGAVQLSKSPDMEPRGTWRPEPGTSVAGGVWPSLNATLIWALALVDGEKAWDEWKKNSFARHAEVYPDVWYGTWSGPDVLNSASSAHPGETTGGAPFGWTDFPVLNLHTHACPLFSAAKLLGLEFTEAGLELRSTLPLAEYRFDSPLVGFSKSAHGYEGWYEPSERGTWTIHLLLPRGESVGKVDVNGVAVEHTRRPDGSIELRGEGGAGERLHWRVVRA
jgi:Glycosyl hydrolase 36 superfamily, catalytic domain/Glycosyltransferase family 36